MGYEFQLPLLDTTPDRFIAVLKDYWKDHPPLWEDGWYPLGVHHHRDGARETLTISAGRVATTLQELACEDGSDMKRLDVVVLPVSYERVLVRLVWQDLDDHVRKLAAYIAELYPESRAAIRAAFLSERDELATADSEVNATRRKVTFIIKASARGVVDFLQGFSKGAEWEDAIPWEERSVMLLPYFGGPPDKEFGSLVHKHGDLQGRIVATFFSRSKPNERPGEEVAIGFKWTQIDDKLRVTTECYEPVAEEHFRRMLREMRQVWPESGVQIDAYLGSGESAAEEGLAPVPVRISGSQAGKPEPVTTRDHAGFLPTRDFRFTYPASTSYVHHILSSLLLSWRLHATWSQTGGQQSVFPFDSIARPTDPPPCLPALSADTIYRLLEYKWDRAVTRTDLFAFVYRVIAHQPEPAKPLWQADIATITLNAQRPNECAATLTFDPKPAWTQTREPVEGVVVEWGQDCAYRLWRGLISEQIGVKPGTDLTGKPAAIQSQAMENGTERTAEVTTAEQAPKKRRLTIANYKTVLPDEYWKYCTEHGERPTVSDLATVLFVSESTIDRRISDIRKGGGIWPPPPSDHS
ncbi:MAG: hypothetical protein EPO21_07035 [Chloroflexota bacterium]|nr:MAG: hypothetical protein EPO21_07035 [Chloroflexota bacterium]